MAPSLAPSVAPSLAPSMAPSLAPSVAPSLAPSVAPSLAPSVAPSLAPTLAPSQSPSLPPSMAPSVAPSVAPSLAPSTSPSVAPTERCTTMIVNIISIADSHVNIAGEHWNGHYIEDAVMAYDRPQWGKDTDEDPLNSEGSISWRPNTWVLRSGITQHEWIFQDDKHLHPPTGQSSTWKYYLDVSVTAEIELECSESLAPSGAPTDAPSQSPTQPPSKAPSAAPTATPSATPTTSPSAAPSNAPSLAPSSTPTGKPSLAPSATPTAAPSSVPSVAPSLAPTQPPTQSPITSCELLRVRIQSIVSRGAKAGGLSDYQSEFDSSFEQQSKLMHFRSNWLRKSDGARITYDGVNNQWMVIGASNYNMMVLSTDEMPPIAADWSVSSTEADSSSASAAVVSVTTECAVYTDEPTAQPTKAPVTSAPSIETEAPSVPPTLSPTTLEPTTARPTMKEGCEGYRISVVFQLIEWVQTQQTEEEIKYLVVGAVTEIILETKAMEEWNDAWCVVINDEDITFTEMGNSEGRRRILQDVVNTKVETVLSVNDALEDAYFGNYNERKFQHFLESKIEPQLPQNGGGAMLVLNVSDPESIAITTTEIKEEEESGGLLGLEGECPVFGMICWHLILIAVVLICVCVIFVTWFCQKTKKEIASGKFHDLKAAEPASPSGDVEMQPHPVSPQEEEPQNDGDEVQKTATGRATKRGG
eukprot:429860_1